MDYKRHAFPAGNNLMLQEMNSTTVTFTSSGQKMAMFLFPFGSEVRTLFEFCFQAPKQRKHPAWQSSISEHSTNFIQGKRKISVGLISSRKKVDVINFMIRPWVLAQYMFNWNMEKKMAFTFIMYKPTHWSCDTDLTLNSTQDTDNAGRNNQDLSCFCFESQDQIY